MKEIMFSIIVVCYNAGDKLKQTVNSILKQEFLDYEIVIEDGMSTDGSVENLPKHDKVRIFSRKDKGIYDAMNQAVKETSGKYLYFLNCGDTFYQDSILQQLHEFICNTPKRGIYYGDTYNETAQAVVLVPKVITAFTCYRHIPCHQACIYEKNLCVEKPYDLSYQIRADYDHFLWCFFEKQVIPAHIGLIVSNYEGSGFSETAKNQKRDKNEHKVIVEHYMSRRELVLYRFVLFLTLAPLRKRMGNSKVVSKWYQGIKQYIYR